MAWHRGGMQLVLLLATLLFFGSTNADAAYRLLFQNGTSVEVRSYEDLGDSIRYPRFNGTVTVPKANVSSIEELPLPPTNPAPATPARQLPPAASPLSQSRSYQPVETPPPPAARPVPAPAPTKLVPPVPIDFTAGARTIIGSFAVILFIVLGIFLLIRVVPLIRGKDGDALPLLDVWQGRKHKEHVSSPYERRASLLTAAERSFYGVLLQTVDHQYVIFAKVRLGDLLHIPWGTSKFRSHLSRIDRKHVDFVLCDSVSFAPLLIIELDDSSHDREDRRERDTFVDAALEAAGLPILHVSAQHSYAPAEVRAQIYGCLDAGTRPMANAEGHVL